MVNVCILTYGCASNFSDSEVIAGILSKNGFRIVEEPKDSFLIIINSCTVKGEKNIKKTFSKLYSEFPNKKFLIAGCLTERLINEITEISEDASFLSTHNIDDIICAVEETINDNPIRMTDVPEKHGKKIGLPRIRKNSIVSIIPISTGCLSECSYCSVRLIKGKLHSYPIEDIIKEAEDAIASGCKEIWITSQDTACYGLDLYSEQRLPELLRSILAIGGDFKVRLGMGNPQFMHKIKDDMLQIISHPKMFRFLHIPAQSGNDDILKKMNRGYSRESYIGLVKFFRASIPDITIATDIICGFPTETDEQFKDSLNLLDETMPDIVNISKYQARKGTSAESLIEVAPETIKDRSRAMTSHFDWIAYERNKVWKDWKGKALVDEKGKDGTYVARNLSYKPIIIDEDVVMGEYVEVEVYAIAKYDLKARIKR